MNFEIDYWQGCYPSSWKGAIVDDAFRHPAKFSSKLIRRIYDHLVAEGWVKAGDTVVDPFGGVALGGLDAMRLGLHWRGCELESHFVEIGNRNIEFWADRFGWLPGDAQLLQGDSRFLAQVLVGSASTTSTPVVGLSSPPYGESKHEGGDALPDKMQGGPMFIPGYAGSVSSPPYASSVNAHDAANDTDARVERMKRAGIDVSKRENIGGPSGVARNDQAYGASAGQLGAMKATGFDVAVTSPPFLQSRGGTPEPKEGGAIDKSLYARHAAGNAAANGYGESAGQLSSMDSGGDFWLATRAIVEQVYQVLAPGGHAVWVVKDYVRNKERVPFCDQWRQVCEAVGFVTLHEHRALLVHRKGTQQKLDGGELEIVTESKSFFRRLVEKKGSPRIDWEVVFCMVKPVDPE